MHHGHSDLLQRGSSVKRKEHSSRGSTSSEKKKKASKSQATAESKTHPHFWESCWSEFGAWYVMLLGLVKLSRYNSPSIQGTVKLDFCSLVHNEDSQPLGMKTDGAKDRG